MSRGCEALLEDNVPQKDLRGFRKCLGQFGTGVTVVTTNAEGVPVGVTANSFSSLSLDPPLVMWAIGRRSRSYPAFGAASRFAVNILSDSQVEISRRFASEAENKFADVPWSPGACGPILDGALALLECEREAVSDAGDHIILIGRVQRFKMYAGSPLLYVQGRYAIADD
jgi:flavin reductase (DIM6/NTAB) family NADH-FMN oxidoreductase RutF